MKVKHPLTRVVPAPLALGSLGVAALQHVRRGRTRIAYPWPTYAGARILGMLPIAARAWFFGRMPAKAADGNI